MLVSTLMLTAALLDPPVVAASVATANARPATHSERQAISSAFAREDGNASEIRSVYVSRSNASLAVACAKTPEAGIYAYVFTRSHGRWHYTVSGRPGRAGSYSQRKLVQACV
jgi:hypothetical protein